MRLGIYCRISRSKNEGKDRSIDNQKQIGIEKAKELGIDYEVYIDEGLSGFGDKIEDRPQFEKLLSDVSSGYLTSVFAFDQSRFERNIQVRFYINNIFKEHGITYYTHVDGQVDLFDAQSEFFGDIQSVINKYHVTMTKIKVKSVLKQRALEAKTHGIVAYGYGKDSGGFFVVNPQEAKVIKQIFALSLKGIGTRSIAEMLNNEGVQTRYNKIATGTLTVENKYTKQKTTIQKKEIKWSGNTIRNIITNTIYKGQRVYNGMVISVPSILDADYFDKVNANLTNNRNNTGKKVVHRYLLKGLIRCGICGRNMYGRARVNKKDYSYMCSSKRLKNGSCANRSINIDKIEDFIWHNLFQKEGFTQRIEAEFTQSKESSVALGKEIEFLNKAIASLSAEKQKAIDLTLKNIVTESELSAIVKRIDAQIKDTHFKLVEVKKTFGNIKDGEELILKYKNKFVDFTKLTSFTQKQKVVNDFIKNITVTFVNDSHYVINIEYKIAIEDEQWQSYNMLDSTFVRLTKNLNGENKAYLSIPPPIKNPEDNSRYKKFTDKVDAEDEKRIKWSKKHQS